MLMLTYSKAELSLFLKSKNIYLSKNYGQNFLLDPNILNKIVETINFKDNAIVIEIGCGLGHLTQFILTKELKQLFCFEIDKKIYKEALSNISKLKYNKKTKVLLLNKDFIKYDLSLLKIPSKSNLYIISNTPYNISSLIIEKCLNLNYNINFITLLLQKEYADRLVYNNKSKNNSLALFANTYGYIKTYNLVKRDSFFPVPNVDSKIVKIECHNNIINKIDNINLYHQIIKYLFTKKRKVALNSIYEMFNIKKSDIINIYQKINLNTNVRPENITIRQYVFISNVINRLLKI